MRKLYDFVFAVGFGLSAPYYFLKMWRRGGWRDGFAQRFGKFDGKIKQAVTNRHVLWLHAVSVGEVNLCTQLIAALEPRAPNLKIAVSTTTSTGMGELRRKLPSHILKIYYPIDKRRCVQKAFQVLHPVAVVLVEAEIWPNFLWAARDRHVPVFLVNARMSDRSFRGYRRWSRLFRPLFAQMSAVGVPTEADAERMRLLGCQPEAVRVVGNLKFDAVKLDERRPLDVPRMWRQLGIAPDAPVIVAGSTHAGEEALLAEMLPRLRARFPGLFLVLVPRHFERGKDVGRQLRECGVKFVFRSQIGPKTQMAPGQLDCLLVNTTGELRYFYEHATAVFVGKSLTARGGQSPIEPGALGKALLFGPHMDNFRAVAASFVQGGGAIQVADAAELERALAGLLAEPSRRAELGRNALRVVRENQGSVARTADLILEQIRDDDVYVTPEVPAAPAEPRR
jgi:3-deoxy-D-manno-octulosonic-acid transferase